MIVFIAEAGRCSHLELVHSTRELPVFKCANNSFKRAQLACNGELLRPKAAEMKQNLK